jgi:hypothetical protein
MNKTPISFTLVLLACLCFGLYYFIDAFHFGMSYGYDEVIFVWPIGRALSEAPLNEFPRILTASFLGEDHLSPVCGIVSYLLYSEKRDPIITLGWATKILYLVIIALTIILVNDLWRDRLKNIIVLIILVFSQSLFYGNMGYIMNFNLVTAIALLSIIFFIRYLRSRSNRTMIIFWMLCILGTFTFEQFFIIYPITLALTVVLMYDKKAPYNNAINMVRVYSLPLLTLLPYVIVHYFVYNSFLPASRLAIIGSGDRLNNLMIVGLSFFNDLLFSMPKYLLSVGNPLVKFGIPLAGVIALVFIYFRKGFVLTRYGYAFLCAFVISLFFIMYTGRYHPGLWTISGIVGLIVLADMASNTVKKLTLNGFQVNVSLLATCFLLYGINSMTQPYKKMKINFREESNASNSAYELIGGAADKIVVIRLPGAIPLMQPIPFWVGHEIYNKDYGLRYSQKYRSLHMYGINVEQYENTIDSGFTYFKTLLHAENAAVLFKNRNAYFTLGTGENGADIFKEVIIPESPLDSFDIYLPDFIFKSPAALKVELDFDKSAKIPGQIVFNGNVCSDVQIIKNKISFSVKNGNRYNSLKFLPNTGYDLRKIRVNYDMGTQKRNLVNDSRIDSVWPKIRLQSKGDCFFNLHEMNRSGLTVMGSLEPGRPDSSFVFTRFLDPKTLLQITYWSSRSHAAKQVSNIKFAQGAHIELVP